MVEDPVRHQCGSFYEKPSISGKSCREKEQGKKEGAVCVCARRRVRVWLSLKVRMDLNLKMQFRCPLPWVDLGTCPLLQRRLLLDLSGRT